MSRFDYVQSRVIMAEGYPFYALIMAAARQADTANYAKLTNAFPDVIEELEQRYHAPDGRLPSDRE